MRSITAVIGRVILTVLALAVLATPALADNYVSWKGEFYITYPDHWHQVDYQTVDVFLLRSQADWSSMDYEGVFADTAAIPFFVGDYLILTVDTVGKLTRAQMDSVVTELSFLYEKSYRLRPFREAIKDATEKVPLYDTAGHMVCARARIGLTGDAAKMSWTLWRFYDKGIATFYFYSPDSLFEDRLPLFADIVESFSTENIEAASAGGDVRVTDARPKERSVSETGEDEGTSSVSLILIAGAVALLLILIAVLRRVKRA